MPSGMKAVSYSGVEKRQGRRCETSQKLVGSRNVVSPNGSDREETRPRRLHAALIEALLRAVRRLVVAERAREARSRRPTSRYRATEVHSVTGPAASLCLTADLSDPMPSIRRLREPCYGS